jgi:hypothetical protein
MKKLREHITQLLNSEHPLDDVVAYITGNIRYHLFYNKHLMFLMREHIRQQIEYRIDSIDRECFNSAQCKLCGCDIPGLQMANKACDKPCYPKMLSKKQWEYLKADNFVNSEGKTWFIEDGKFHIMKHINPLKAWDALAKDAGIAKQNTKVTLYFNYLGDSNKIPTIGKSCGCVSAGWDNKKKQAFLTLKTGKFPTHLKTDELTKRQNISVRFDKGEVYTLTGSCKIKRR